MMRLPSSVSAIFSEMGVLSLEESNPLKRERERERERKKERKKKRKKEKETESKINNSQVLCSIVSLKGARVIQKENHKVKQN